MRNVMAKSRKPGNGYVRVSSDGWTWEILKLYKTVTSSRTDEYSRAFCFVFSPFCPDGEMGDVYLTDIASSVGEEVLWGQLERAEGALVAERGNA